MTHAQRMRRRRRGSGGRSKAFLALMVVGILVVLAALGGVGYVVSIAASAPPLSSLKPKATGDNTRVFAADGRALGFIQADELHLPMRSEEIPQLVKDATVAIEDERFYHHKGVDYEGVVRAAIKNVTSGKTVQGGSTITMQLVRSLYISSERTYTRKIREAKLAEELEDQQSKQWILEKYLDSIPYGTVGGQSAIGIKAAAKIYFSKNLRDLTLPQAALLAGLPQAPSDYSPIRSRRAAKYRRNEVIRKMEELKMITPEQADKAVDAPLGLKLSSYFSKRREEYFFDYVKDQLFREYGAQTVRAGGMKVYTTIDLNKQAEARDTISDHLAGHRPVVGDRDDQPEERLHRDDGVVGRLRPVELQPRRAGPPPAGLDVQGDGADDGAAARRRPRLDALHVGLADACRRPALRAQFDIKTYGGVGAGNLSLRQATLQVRQLGLHPARARPRARTRSRRPRATWASRRR